MTITLDLPLDTKVRIEQEAARREKPVEEYVLSLIENALPPMPDLKTGADVVAYWKSRGLIGDWAGREDIGEGDDYAGRLRQRAETREHE